ncbi:MAG TPA: RNA-binding cell elongation regulator Jag/EloR [Dictyobacter sp.]|nr:RNA-binding cell elongation regulator Jag/EloR [Dictyobacter sp.]
MDSIEASGKSIEEAVAQALSRLGKRSDEVDVVVLQEPGRGAFGIGVREARVRVTAHPTSTGSSRGAVITPEMADAILGTGDIEVPLPEDEEETFYDDEVEEYDEGEDEELEEEDLEDESEEDAVPFISSMPAQPQQVVEQPAAEGTEEDVLEVEHPTREDIEITVDVLQHVLRYMNIHASVQVRATSPLTLNIRGMHENLGLLIGRRGETLAALQLLVNLIVRHRTKRRMRIIVDAENYRERREANLRSLALRVAQQVRSYRRSIALEAMPPHERRIVHIALSESSDISTESIGEGDERRVVISLKRPAR